jgi:hypothetical protein
MAREVVLISNIYNGSGELIAIVKFFLTETRKWGKVIAEEGMKKVLEDRLKFWEGPLDNGKDVFDVLHDLRDVLGFDYKIVSMGVVE